MLQLTQKGKEIYKSLTGGKYELRTITISDKISFCITVLDMFTTGPKDYIIASNPLELKALVDLGLIEIN